jgi:hypothetical protein
MTLPSNRKRADDREKSNCRVSAIETLACVCVSDLTTEQQSKEDFPMRYTVIRSESWARRSLDAITAAIAAAWPGSAAVKDARRLASEEFAGRTSTVEFLVDVDAERSLAVAADLRDAGFDVVIPGSLPAGFLVVRARLPLRPYHLHRLTTQLSRLIRPSAGIAIVVACAFAQPGISQGLAA